MPSSKLIFTKIGGGVFGNDHRWIASAMNAAINKYKNHGLQVELLHYGSKESEYDAIHIS